MLYIYSNITSRSTTARIPSKKLSSQILHNQLVVQFVNFSKTAIYKSTT
eukprot:UN01037